MYQNIFSWINYYKLNFNLSKIIQQLTNFLDYLDKLKIINYLLRPISLDNSQH